MDIVLAVLLGLGLAAACGFRVFVPLLILSIAGKAGAVSLVGGWSWLASDYALIAFGAASLIEIVAYLVPWVDHALDVIATPTAVVAGSLIAASQFQYVGIQGELLKWTLAVIAGGGAAAGIQAGTVAIRSLSTSVTGGLANPLVSIVETSGAVVVSVMAIVVPVLLWVALLVIFAIGWRAWARQRARKSAAESKRIVAAGEPRAAAAH